MLSEPYWKSENCMYELLEFEKNKQLHQRVFLVVLRGARINELEDRLDYIEYWDKKRQSLEEKLRRQTSLAYTRSIQDGIDLCADFRRGIGGLMAIIADMNTLNQDIHLQTDFDELISENSSRLAKKEARIRFRARVQNNVQRQLDRPPLSSLKKALIA